MALSRMEERALVRAAQGGSPDAMERLFALIWPDVVRCARLVAAYPEQVEEIVQEAMLAIFKGLRGFDRRGRLKPWCWFITLNAGRAYKGAEATSRERSAWVQAVSRERVGSPLEIEAVEDQVGVRQGLECLDASQTQILTYISEGKTVREIAKALGLSKSTVHHRRTEALDALRKELDS